MYKDILKTSKNFYTTAQQFPEVRYVGDPILRQETKEVSVKEGLDIGERLGEVLMRYRRVVGYGRGFTAPQIGESKSVFVTFVDDKLNIFINPVITHRSKETNFYKELCLSSGPMAVDVERSREITMEWIDIKGLEHKEHFDSFLARLYQHEEDHLRGILNLDIAKKGDIELVTFDPLKETLRDNI